MRSLAQDLRHAVRLLRRSPGFTVVETLTRLLGIGATSANFSVVPRRPDKARWWFLPAAALPLAILSIPVVRDVLSVRAG